MKRIKLHILAVWLLFSLFSLGACTPGEITGKETVGRETTGKGTALEASKTEPQIFTAEDKNFNVKTYINKLTFKENEVIEMHSTIEYIGDKESITIWSGIPYFHHTIHDGQKFINGSITATVLKPTELKKGEIYTVPFQKNGGYGQEDPNADFFKKYLAEKELRLPKGEFTFTAYTAFTLDQEQKEKVVLKNEFKVNIK